MICKTLVFGFWLLVGIGQGRGGERRGYEFFDIGRELGEDRLQAEVPSIDEGGGGSFFDGEAGAVDAVEGRSGGGSGGGGVESKADGHDGRRFFEVGEIAVEFGEESLEEPTGGRGEAGDGNGREDTASGEPAAGGVSD